MDVTSLYTSIPIPDGLTALKYFLESDNPTSHTTSTLIRLAELVLTTASFTFNGSYYRQLTGVSMGTCMGPSFACLFMGYLEQQIFNKYDGTKPLLFKRYIDDCVGAASCSYDELTNFINYMNSFHPAIKFTHEISYTSVTFLDIDVSIKGSTLTTSVHYKPTDAHTYLNYESSHPPKCKDSIPYSQLVRLRRICKQDDDFNTRAKEMMSFFSNRGYPTNITDGCLNKINKMTRENALLPRESSASTERIPLVLTYHPITKQVAEIITKNFEILSSDQATSNVFTSPPMHAYRRDKNLKDTLVHSNVKSTHNPPPIGSTTACNRPRCKTCAHVYSTDTIHGPASTFKIRDSFSCISCNIVYAIICTKCRLLYVGETKRRMSDRFTEHLRSIKLKLPGLPVATHFSNNNHSLKDIQITGLTLCNGSDNMRRNTEERIIYKLGTLAPNGLNISFKSFRN